MRRFFLISFFLILIIDLSFAKSRPKLLIYCGITMAKPIKEISLEIEKMYDCDIEIMQGGSKDLYDSLVFSKVGDLYLPGSEYYIQKCKKDGFCSYGAYIGYNQAAIFVQKGNPKHIKNLDDLLREDVSTILCDPDSGSIGKMTKTILIKYKGEDFFESAYQKAVEIGTDSRSLNSYLINKDVDMAINWLATAYWKENKNYIDTIKLNPSIAPKKRLIMSLLKFSKHKDIAEAFIKYASSKEGRAIMKKYGFLGDKRK